MNEKALGQIKFSQFESLLAMHLGLKEIWDAPRIRAEANSIEDNLLKTTRKLMTMERQYRLKKWSFWREWKHMRKG